MVCYRRLVRWLPFTGNPSSAVYEFKEAPSRTIMGAGAGAFSAVHI